MLSKRIDLTYVTKIKDQIAAIYLSIELISSVRYWGIVKPKPQFFSKDLRMICNQHDILNDF